MSHKKIMKSCAMKLDKDAKKYKREEKEAMSAAKVMKQKAKKAKD
jgi:hypothetical protein